MRLVVGLMRYESATSLAAYLYRHSSIIDLVRMFDNGVEDREIVRPVLAVRLWDLERKTGCVTGWEQLMDSK